MDGRSATTLNIWDNGKLEQVTTQDSITIDNEIENQRIVNFITHRNLITESAQLSAKDFEARLQALTPLTAPKNPATTTVMGLPQQGEESLFDAILKHPGLDTLSQFTWIKYLISSQGYRNYAHMLFAEPAINRLLAIDNAAPSLADLYVDGVRNHGVMMKPVYEIELWKKIIKGGDSCCEFLLQELVTTAKSPQTISEFVAFWRDQTVTIEQPAAVAAFYRNVVELTRDANNAAFNQLLATMSNPGVSVMKTLPQDMAPGMMSAPMPMFMQQPMMRMPTPAPAIDYATFKNEYLREVKHDLDKGEYKAEAEMANWSLLIAHDDAKSLYDLFKAQPGSKGKQDLILLFLYVWMHQAVNVESTRKIVFPYYEEWLRPNTMHQPDAGEKALWKALLKNDPGYNFGRELFAKILSHRGNTAKLLDFESVWLDSIASIDQRHLAEHHGIKMCDFLNMTPFGKHEDEIKMVWQVRGLEWMEAHPATVVSKEVEDSLTSGKRGKLSSRHVFGLFKDFKQEEGKQALADYKANVQQHINELYEKDKEKEGLTGNKFTF